MGGKISLITELSLKIVPPPQINHISYLQFNYNYLLTYYFRPNYDSASNRNEYPRYPLG